MAILLKAPDRLTKDTPPVLRTPFINRPRLTDLFSRLSSARWTQRPASTQEELAYFGFSPKAIKAFMGTLGVTDLCVSFDTKQTVSVDDSGQIHPLTREEARAHYEEKFEAYLLQGLIGDQEETPEYFTVNLKTPESAPAPATAPPPPAQ